MGNLSGFVKRLRDIMRNDAGINGDAQRIEQIAWMLFLKVYDAKEKNWEWNDDGYVSIIPENCRWANWAADDRSGSAMTGDRLLDFVNNTIFPTLKKLPVTASTPIRKAIVQTTFADANGFLFGTDNAKVSIKKKLLSDLKVHSRNLANTSFRRGKHAHDLRVRHKIPANPWIRCRQRHILR